MWATKQVILASGTSDLPIPNTRVKGEEAVTNILRVPSGLDMINIL